MHSAGTTVREALVFSARLRLTEDITLAQVPAVPSAARNEWDKCVCQMPRRHCANLPPAELPCFSGLWFILQIEGLVEDTLRMVDLTALQHSIVGEPGESSDAAFRPCSPASRFVCGLAGTTAHQAGYGDAEAALSRASGAAHSHFLCPLPPQTAVQVAWGFLLSSASGSPSEWSSWPTRRCVGWVHSLLQLVQLPEHSEHAARHRQLGCASGALILCAISLPPGNTRFFLPSNSGGDDG